MLKRLCDIMVSIAVLILAAPLLAVVLLLVWRQDGRSPFYRAPRVGCAGRDFTMVKVRSMVTGADRTGVSSTSTQDARITPLGSNIRRYKIDELPQFWNVLKGDMSLVGPRPNTRETGVDLYTRQERRLLDVRPGITDLASIVFSDEGEILAGSKDPELKYNQLIRPWKSRLGLIYVERHTFWMDLRILVLTAVAIINRKAALAGVGRILAELDAPANLIAVARRGSALDAYPPPGATEIVQQR